LLLLAGGSAAVLLLLLLRSAAAAAVRADGRGEPAFIAFHLKVRPGSTRNPGPHARVLCGCGRVTRLCRSPVCAHEPSLGTRTR